MVTLVVTLGKKTNQMQSTFSAAMFQSHGVRANLQESKIAMNGICTWRRDRVGRKQLQSAQQKESKTQT